MADANPENPTAPDAADAGAGPASPLASARRVVVCARWGIGDLVTQLPALAALRRAAPAAEVVALAARPASDLLRAGEPATSREPQTAGGPLADAVVDVQALGFASHGHDGSADDGRAGAAARVWLRSLGPVDAVVDPWQAPPALASVLAEFAASTGAALLPSDDAAERSATAPGLPPAEAVARGAEAGWGVRVGRVAPAGSDVPVAVPSFDPPPWAAARAAALLDRLGVGDAAPAAVAPGASLDLKRWPADRFAAVADALAGATGRRVLVVVGPDESASGPAVLAASRAPGRLAVVGAVPVAVTAAVLARCRVVVANDTGVMHLAAAVGAPVVGVFGPTSPRVLLPAGRSPTAAASPRAGPGADCPHRVTDRLGVMPACWWPARCLLADPSDSSGLPPRGCVTTVEVADVLAAVARVALGLLPDRVAFAGRRHDNRLTPLANSSTGDLRDVLAAGRG